MLEQLTIKKLGLIDSANLQFSRGLIVISGETGAGKTLLLDGLVALTGFKPASADMVEDDTFIEGIFDLSNLAAEIASRGVELDDGHLYIARQFPKDGKSRASLQAKSAPSSLLREISEHWIAIHGQHDTYRLLNPKTHLSMLDEFGGQEISSLRSSVSMAFRTYVDVSQRLKTLQRERETALSVAQTLREDVELCEALAIQPDEDRTIAETIRLIADAESVIEYLRSALDSLDSDEVSVASSIARALASLEKISHADSEIASVLTELSEASEVIKESQSKIFRVLERISGSEADIDALMQRQQQIKRLLQKYGPTTGDLNVWLEAAKQQLQLVDIGDETIAKLEYEVSHANQDLMHQCKTLHDARVRYARELESVASQELNDLALSMARFEIEIKDAAMTESGSDAIEFMFSANPGMKLSPLQESASGGELSRLMLALEVSLLKDNSVPVMIFDEIDTGVAGATALSIAKKLVLVSQKSQVFVVSHLPQIAAFADQHFVVRKTFSAESTTTDVLELDDVERITELARMLAGLEGSDSARDHAEELLEKARAAKASLKK